MNNINNEIWKVIEDFPDYLISNLGRVKSFKRYKNGKILKPSKNTKGYFKIELCKNKKQHTREIHRLVYESFHKKLKYYECAHHKDENKENNYYENLESMTKIDHKVYHSKGKKNSQYNKECSKEKRMNISNSLKGKYIGEKNSMFGKHLSEESKNKLRESHFGKYHSEETKKKMSETRKEKYLGDNSPNHKLTEEQVIQIKILLLEGNLTQQEIAGVFGVNRRTISSIKTGKIWSHIKLNGEL